MSEHEEFKLLLEKYQYGRLSEDEKEYVESELKKAEAIQEYLFSLEELPADEEIPLFEAEDVKHIQKVVQKKWLKQGIITAIAVLIVLAGGYFLGRPLLNQLYFNPLEGKSEKTYSSFELYERIHADLLMDDSLSLTGLDIQQTGVGTYQIQRQYVDVFRNSYLIRPITMKKNQIDYQPASVSYQSFLPSNEISTEKMVDNSPNPNLTDLKERIQGLPESSFVKVKLFFEPYKKVGLNQIQSFVKQHDLDYVLSAGILSTEDSSIAPSTYGLNFSRSFMRAFNQIDSITHKAQLDQLNEKYPELLPGSSLRIGMNSEKLEQHYLSALNYLIDQETLGTEIEKIYFAEIYDPETKAEQEVSQFYQKNIDRLKEAKSVFEKKGLIVSTLTIVIQPHQFDSVIDNELISRVGFEGVELENNLLWSDF